ncbi:hypothetical protein RclHR1_00810014 [Rhizophagus clarus]|uniref:Uncharacterized protein n=1 Tax=Rhizophagus clarus TaxID=94130 RepID=A0A2Z6SF08_9GLOM|nr:hypothetical protein RclHR1_00810014 [Rhizophagus clarus]
MIMEVLDHLTNNFAKDWESERVWRGIIKRITQTNVQEYIQILPSHSFQKPKRSTFMQSFASNFLVVFLLYMPTKQ